MELTNAEIKALINYNYNKAEYALACKQTQARFARTKPLWKSGGKQTVADWLESAAEWERKRKYYRTRELFFEKMLKGN